MVDLPEGQAGDATAAAVSGVSARERHSGAADIRTAVRPGGTSVLASNLSGGFHGGQIGGRGCTNPDEMRHSVGGRGYVRGLAPRLAGEQVAEIEAAVLLLRGRPPVRRGVGHPEPAGRGLEQDVVQVRLHAHRRGP